MPKIPNRIPPSVLIVESKDGQVFVIENKEEKSLVEKILESKDSEPKSNAITNTKNPQQHRNKNNKETPFDNSSSISSIKPEPEDRRDIVISSFDTPAKNHDKRNIQEILFIDARNALSVKLEPEEKQILVCSDKARKQLNKKSSEEIPLNKRSNAINIKQEPELHISEIISDDNSSLGDNFDDRFSDSDDEPLVNLKRKLQPKKKAIKNESKPIKKGKTKRVFKRPFQLECGNYKANFIIII